MGRRRRRRKDAGKASVQQTKDMKKNLAISKPAAVLYSRGCALLWRSHDEAWPQPYTGTHTQMWLIEAGEWEGNGHEQGVSCTDNKQTMKETTVAFTGHSAAAALSWWPSDGREEERWRGVSTTDEKNIIKRTPLTIQGLPVLIVADRCAC